MSIPENYRIKRRGCDNCIIDVVIYHHKYAERRSSKASIGTLAISEDGPHPLLIPMSPVFPYDLSNFWQHRPKPL